MTTLNHHMKIVATKIDNEEFEKFNNKCLENGRSKSEVVRSMIRNFTKEREQQNTQPKLTIRDAEEPKEIEVIRM